jgi:hypothetical protein
VFVEEHSGALLDNGTLLQVLHEAPQDHLLNYSRFLKEVKLMTYMSRR